jgi:ubiquitin-like modifier-activating enzyme ATG7
MIASGMAVEMLTSVLQHEFGPAAPARLADVDENSSVLGGTPHQIRGFLSRFNIMTPTVRRFEKCTACGDAVKECYQRDGFNFLNQVFDNPTELEKVTGLTELHATATDLQLDVFEFDDNESITSN